MITDRCFILEASNTFSKLLYELYAQGSFNYCRNAATSGGGTRELFNSTQQHNHLGQEVKNITSN